MMITERELHLEYEKERFRALLEAEKMAEISEKQEATEGDNAAVEGMQVEPEELKPTATELREQKRKKELVMRADFIKSLQQEQDQLYEKMTTIIAESRRKKSSNKMDKQSKASDMDNLLPSRLDTSNSVPESADVLNDNKDTTNNDTTTSTTTSITTSTTTATDAATTAAAPEITTTTAAATETGTESTSTETTSSSTPTTLNVTPASNLPSSSTHIALAVPKFSSSLDALAPSPRPYSTFIQDHEVAESDVVAAIRESLMLGAGDTSSVPSLTDLMQQMKGAAAKVGSPIVSPSLRHRVLSRDQDGSDQNQRVSITHRGSLAFRRPSVAAEAAEGIVRPFISSSGAAEVGSPKQGSPSNITRRMSRKLSQSTQSTRSKLRSSVRRTSWISRSKLRRASTLQGLGPSSEEQAAAVFDEEVYRAAGLSMPGSPEARKSSILHARTSVTGSPPTIASPRLSQRAGLRSPPKSIRSPLQSAMRSPWGKTVRGLASPLAQARQSLQDSDRTKDEEEPMSSPSLLTRRTSQLSSTSMTSPNMRGRSSISLRKSSSVTDEGQRRAVYVARGPETSKHKSFPMCQFRCTFMVSHGRGVLVTFEWHCRFDL